MNVHDINKLIASTAAKLREHVDAIQICVTSTHGEATFTAYYGLGNWHSRVNLCREFVQRDDAQRIAQEIKNVLPKTNPPDTGEEWKNDKP